MDVASEIALSCRCLLIGVFAGSVWAKLHNPPAFRAFAGSLVALRLVPARLSRPTAAVVAGAESATLAFLAVPALLTPVALTAGFLVAAAVLVVLSAGLVLALTRGAAVPCRCFGAGRRPVGAVHVVRNAVLLLAALGGAGATLVGPGPLSPVAAVPAVVVAAAGLLGLHYLDDLATLFDPLPGPAPGPGRRPPPGPPGRPPPPDRQEPAHQCGHRARHGAAPRTWRSPPGRRSPAGSPRAT